MRTTDSNNRSARGRGFTLIELLVTIAIIALLAGMVVPVITIVIDRAIAANCATNLTGVTTALKGYVADHFSLPYIRNGENAAEYASYDKDDIMFDENLTTSGWTNLGLLWYGNPDVEKGKYIKDEGHFWCPKTPRSSEAALGPWLPVSGTVTKATYSRRPACGGKTPDRIPDGAAIVADLFPRREGYARRPEHMHQNGKGFHVGYYGGKVKWFDDSEDGIAMDTDGFLSYTKTEQSWHKLDKCEIPWTADAYLN